MVRCVALLCCLAVPVLAAGQEPSDVERKVLALCEELKSDETTARRRAVEALGEIGPKAKAAEKGLLAAAADKDRFVRRGVARALVLIQADPKEAIPVLAKLLKDENREVAEAAGNSLGHMGAAALPALLAGMKEKDPLVRRVAIQALGELGKDAKPAVPALVEALKSEPAMRRPGRGENIRGVIIQTLGQMGPAAKDALPAIKESLEGNRDRDYRRAAEQTIRKIEGRG